MSKDVRLDANGDPDFAHGHDFVTGVDELKQSLEMRLLSQVGWAADDVEFGVEWLGFFDDETSLELGQAKIADALELDDRVAEVMSVDIEPNYQHRKAYIHTHIKLSDDSIIADNGDPNLDFDSTLSI